MQHSRDQLPVICCDIPCCDRGNPNTPLVRRSYTLDWRHISAEGIDEVLAIVQGSPRRPQLLPSGPDESIVTVSYDHRNADMAILKFRQHFVEVRPFHFADVVESGDRDVLWVGLPDNYYENECGEPITLCELISLRHGVDNPIIVGDPKSIVRLGCCKPRDLPEWNKDTANLISQFLDITGLICMSDWYCTPCALTNRVSRSGVKELLDARHPNHSAVMSVLPFFRQLHASDKLFSTVTDRYMKHCSDGRKCDWISERKATFSHLVDSPPSNPVANVVETRRQIIGMFMYGAGLLHSSSDHGQDAALAKFVKDHDHYQAVIVLHACLMDLLRVVMTARPVIQQDFEYWIGKCGMERPTRFAIRELFAGYSGSGPTNESNIK